MLLFILGCGTFIVGLEPASWEDVVVSAPGDAQILDAREAASWQDGHIPGAANVHWTELTGADEDGLWGALPAEELAALFAERGISSSAPVVIYGSGPEGYGDDGNVYWALRYLGHEDVRVLNGGWTGWLAADGAVAQDDTTAPAQFTAAVKPELLATTAQVASWTGGLLDVRSEEEWLGGHIPDAVWMEWLAVFEGGATLRSPEDLETMFAELGLSAEEPVAIYCAGGIRAGHTFMVLDALGWPDVSNYVGSWARWTAEGGEIE